MDEDISSGLPAGEFCGFRRDMSNRVMGLREGWEKRVRNGSSAVVDPVGDEKEST